MSIRVMTREEYAAIFAEGAEHPQLEYLLRFLRRLYEMEYGDAPLPELPPWERDAIIERLLNEVPGDWEPDDV